MIAAVDALARTGRHLAAVPAEPGITDAETACRVACAARAALYSSTALGWWHGAGFTAVVAVANASALYARPMRSAGNGVAFIRSNLAVVAGLAIIAEASSIAAFSCNTPTDLVSAWPRLKIEDCNLALG